MQHIDYILVTEISSKRLESAVIHLANAFSDTDYVRSIQIHKHKDKSNFRITLPNNPGLKNYSYFFHCVFDSLTSTEAKIYGFYNVKENDDVYPEYFGKRIMLFNINEEYEVGVMGVSSDNIGVLCAPNVGDAEEFQILSHINKSFIEPNYDFTDFEFYKEIFPYDFSCYSESPKGFKEFFYVSNIIGLLEYIHLYIIGLGPLYLIYDLELYKLRNHKEVLGLIIALVITIGLYLTGYLLYKRDQRQNG